VPAPDPAQLHPSTRPELTNVVFLRNQVRSDLIEAGEYTYYDDEGVRGPFETTNVRYLYGPQKLRIGRFTAIGPGAEFLMPGGNHPMAGPSTYPFTMFGGSWTEATLDTFRSLPQAGDTTVGNDVWIGREAVVLPGVTIGDGAVIGARSVVAGDVPPYAVVVGNPARQVRRRFDDEQIAALLRAAWWNWPIDVITEHAATIMAGSPAQLAAVAARRDAAAR
jgi:virginiamycin A acetyltransferase